MEKIMRHLILLSLLILTGFGHVDKLKNSFGFIRSHYVLVKKEAQVCDSCTSSEDEYKLVSSINIELLNNPLLKGSGFVAYQDKDKNIFFTSAHVCEPLKSFLIDAKYRKLINYLEHQILTDEIFPDEKVRASYELSPVITITTFYGNVYKINKFLEINKKEDLCAIEVNIPWGKAVEFSETACEYEEIYNMSASDGFYEKDTVPLRRGFINSKIKEQNLGDETFYNVNLYTLEVKPGSSGSAVFNSKGKVCGNINIAYNSNGLSSGASAESLKSFLKKVLESK